MVADLEQVNKNRRVRIPQRKAQREGDDLAQFGNNSKNRRWTIKIYWRISGSENSNFDKVPSKFEEKFKKTFLENQPNNHTTTQPHNHTTKTQHTRHKTQNTTHKKNTQQQPFWLKVSFSFLACQTVGAQW